MQLSETIIQQYLQGNLSMKDTKEVAKLLDQNPDWPSQYFNEAEWEGMKGAESLGDKKLQDTLLLIKARTYEKPKIGSAKIIYMAIAAASVAAAVMVFVYVGGLISADSGNKNQTASFNKISDTLIHQNSSDTVQLLVLEDGSAIELNPKSAVTYLKKFPVNQRVIGLTGTAFFKVAKDKNRPFEVQTAGFSTIALGTSFRVIASRTSNILTVQLYTGKVVIKQTDNVANFKNVFLMPNQQLVLNTDNLNTNITNINTHTNKIALAEKSTSKQARDWDEYITDTHIQFANTPLTDVFAVLEHQYGVSIKYNATAIKGMVFTGTFKKTDEPQNMLATITTINKLTLLKSGSMHFKIAKD